jgi:bacteriochlorophyll 4-vinyl reductase
MAQTVPEQTMAMVLHVMQEIAGVQAGPILTQAGLGRFLTTPPDRTSMRPAASQEELIQLFRNIYRMLGEDLTRLFMRNYGESTANVLLQLPDVQALLAEIRPVPREQQMRRLAETLEPWMARGWAPLTITEDKDACYMAYEVCYACYGITGAKRPLCAAGDVIFARLAREALGRRVRVVEVECAAMGAERCKYALYK